MKKRRKYDREFKQMTVELALEDPELSPVGLQNNRTKYGKY